MNFRTLLTKQSPFTNNEEKFLLEKFLQKSNRLINVNSEFNGDLINGQLNMLYTHNIVFILKLFNQYYEDGVGIWIKELEVLCYMYIKNLTLFNINLDHLLFFVVVIHASKKSEWKIILMIMQFLKKNYMDLCNHYSFFINNKINPKIIKLNKILSVMNDKIYKSIANYYYISTFERYNTILEKKVHPYYYLNDLYHFSLFKFEKQITTSEQLISLCLINNIHSLYFTKLILKEYNITSKLLLKIIPYFLVKNNDKNIGLFKEMLNILIPEIKDVSSLEHFLSLNIYVPLKNFGLHNTSRNRNILMLMCKSNFFPYDFDIKDVEQLILGFAINRFVDKIETLKLFHHKNINVHLCNDILKKNSPNEKEMVEYLIKQMNFIPTIEFLNYFVNDARISSLCSYYFENVEDEYEDAIILNNTGLIKIENNKTIPDTFKKNTCSFFKIKNNASKEELITMFLKYLIKHHLIISEYFVINEELERLLKIKIGSTLHINTLHSIITHL